MNPDSQASLLALEKELERLHSAVEHIEQAKTVAQKVIGAVGLIQKKYAEHLDALLGVQKEAVREAGSVQQERFDELGASAKRHILESAARAKKYLEDYNAEVVKAIDAAGESAGGSVHDVALKADSIIQTAGIRMDELAGKADQIIGESGSRLDRMLQDLLSRIRDQLNTLNDTAARVIQESGGNVARRIEDVSGKAITAVEGIDAKANSHLEEIGTLARTNLREVMMQAKTSIEEGGNQTKRIFAAIKKVQEQQSVEFEKVTVSADALIAASGKLVRTIDAIDFPARMQSIENDVRTLHFNLNSAMSRLDALAKSNEQAMATFSDDVVAKLGRLEMFTDKAVRTQGTEIDKQLKEQEKQLGTTKVLLIVVLLLNILIAAGTYLVWDGSREPAVPTTQIAPDTTDTLVMPVEKKAEKPARRR